MQEDQVEGGLALVANIPACLHSSDLRAFFCDWVEALRFTCFHYQHRRQDAASTDKNAPRCCLVRLPHSSDVQQLIKKYDGRRWLKQTNKGRGSEREIELSSMCSVSLHHHEPAQQRAVQEEEVQAGSGHTYMNRKQAREARKKLQHTGTTSTLPELLPPLGLPQGNVGTPSSRLRDLADACKLPRSVLKGLGINLTSAVSKNREGEFNFDWRTVGGRGDDYNDDDDDAEEWERHEAEHGGVPEHGWERADRLECKEPLYEEECEDKCWDKGSSGLVFHTDAVRWDADLGDFDARTYDAMDVGEGRERPQCDWERGTKRVAWSAAQRGVVPMIGNARNASEGSGGYVALLQRAEKSGAGHDDAMKVVVHAGGVGEKRSRGEEKQGLKECKAFERDVRGGNAGKIIERMGWKEGEGLGANGHEGEGRMTKRIALDIWARTEAGGLQDKKKMVDTRRGLGFKHSGQAAGAADACGSSVLMSTTDYHEEDVYVKIVSVFDTAASNGRKHQTGGNDTRRPAGEFSKENMEEAARAREAQLAEEDSGNEIESDSDEQHEPPLQHVVGRARRGQAGMGMFCKGGMLGVQGPSQVKGCRRGLGR